MNQAWVLLWLAPQPMSAPEQELLRSWAQRQQMTVVAPHAPPSSSSPTGRPTSETISHIEQLLARARLAADALDRDAALETIDEAEDALGGHPDLPQAPWLLAEALSLRADLAFARGDLEHGNALRRAATALEGPRSPTGQHSAGSNSAGQHSAGQHSAGQHSAGQHSTLSAEEVPSHRPREVTGLRTGDVLYWNGQVVTAARARWQVDTPPGRAHARVLRSGRSVWSAWLDVDSDARSIELSPPAPLPCSEDDLAPMRANGSADAAVLCDRWIAVRPRAQQAADALVSSVVLEIARCHRNQCGAFETWPAPQAPAEALAETPTQPARPPWLGYALAGTAAAAAVTILLLSVTQRSTEERPTWVYGGLK